MGVAPVLAANLRIARCPEEGKLVKILRDSHTLGLARDDGDISWILDGSDGSGSEHELLPGLAEIEDVVLGLVAAVNVLAHSVIVVDVSEVDFGGDHSADVSLRGSKNGHVGGHVWSDSV